MAGVEKERRVPSQPEGEEGLSRQVKKAKGDGIEDDNMDNEMAEGMVVEVTKEGGSIHTGKEIEGNKTGNGKNLVSYLDKVLCLNGDGQDSDVEEDWQTTQRREEDEEDLPDEVGQDLNVDPLCPTFIYSRRQHKENCKKWRNAIVVKLMGKNIASRFLMGRLLRMWNLISTYELTDLDNGYLLLKFKEEKDYAHVLHDGPWIVADHYVIV